MSSLFTFVASYQNAEYLTIITIGLAILAYLSFIWGNANRLNVRLTLFQWTQIYVLGTMLFLCSVILLGKLIVPDNADSLLDLLHLNGFLHKATLQYQQVLLAILRPIL